MRPFVPVDRRILGPGVVEPYVRGFATEDLSLRTDELARFLAWYDETLPAVHRYLMRACAFDRALAEDLVQETYVAALKQIRTAPARELSIGWLFTVARHKLIDHLRRQERERRRLHLVRDVEAAPPSESPDLGDMLRALPPAQRAAIALRYVDDLPVAEVACQLHRSRRATESLLSRARDTLRRQTQGCPDE